MAETYIGRRYTREQEIIRRCALIEGRLGELLDEAATKIIGEERRATMPPLDTSTNLLGKLCSILARITRPTPAVSGLSPALALLLGDSSSIITQRRYAKIGSAPLPTSILDGVGENGGLDRAMHYLAGVGYVGLMADWGYRAGRPYVQTIRPCDLVVEYDPADPSVAIRHAWAHSTKVDGRTVNVVTTWDLSDLDAPSCVVMYGKDDVTAKVYGQRLTGAAYPWRYDDGRPFFPIVVFGSPDRVWDLSNLASASLQAGVYRFCLAGIVVDSGYPHRNVSNLTTATTTRSPDGVATTGNGGQKSTAPGPADVVQWWRVDDTNETGNWQWDPGGDPAQLLDVILKYESAAASQIGVPLVLTQVGGAPLESEVAAQEEAIQAMASTVRSGIAVLLRRLAAIANRQAEAGILQGWTPVDEAIPGVLLRAEIKEALEEAAPPPAVEPVTPDPSDDSEDDPVDDPEEPDSDDTDKPETE
jgi:hypothetical protein